MADPSSALHTALLTEIDNAVSCTVYDEPPADRQAVTYPYMAVELTTSDNDDMLNKRMDLRYYYINIWSRSGGKREVMQIHEEIQTLSEQPITLTTGEVVSLRCERFRVAREEDNLTQRGQALLRIYTLHS